MEETDSASFTILVVSSGGVQQKQEQRQIAQVLYENFYPVNGC